MGEVHFRTSERTRHRTGPNVVPMERPKVITDAGCLVFLNKAYSTVN